MNSRIKQIEEIQSQLKIFSGKKPDLSYQIKALSDFFLSTENILKYLSWLILRAPRLNKEKIIEINDLDKPEWEKTMHKSLISVQEKKFPGIIEPLVEKIYKEIILASSTKVKLINLGSGGMEIEKQIIKKLIENKIDKRVIFIGNDKSLSAIETARENLKTMENLINVEEFNLLTVPEIEKFEKDDNKKINVLLCQNNIFELDKYFSPYFFDVSFNSLFSHHLDEKQKILIRNIMKTIAKKAYEYDGYKTKWSIVPQSIEAWNNLVFLNASIFSILRYRNKKEILKQKGLTGVKFFWQGFYLAEIKKEV